MSLTWHIVRKDLRRLAGPVAGWLAFQVAVAGAVLATSWTPESLTLRAAADWMQTLRAGLAAAALIGTSALVLLAGVLVLDDRVVGTESFWLTRPMSGCRLLRAKLLAASGLFVAAPALALVPVWLAAGFEVAEVARVAAEMALANALLTIVALGLAALTKNLGQQAFAALVLLGLTVVAMEVLPTLAGRNETTRAAIGTQAWLVLGIFVVAAGAALAWQYRTRQTSKGWGIWLVAIAAVAGVRLGWTWDLSHWGRYAEPTATEQPSELTIAANRHVAERNRGAAWLLEVRGPVDKAVLVAPVTGEGALRGADGATIPVDFGWGDRWGFEAARRVAGLGEAGYACRWELAARDGRETERQARGRASTFTGCIEFVRLQGEVLYEMPVKVGAVAQRGATRTRIVGWAEGSVDTLLVEERRAARGFPAVQTAPILVEHYLLARRASGEVRNVRVLGQRGAGSGGLAVNILALTPEPGADLEREGWTLVKVRLRPVKWWMRRVTDMPLVEWAGATEDRS